MDELEIPPNVFRVIDAVGQYDSRGCANAKKTNGASGKDLHDSVFSFGLLRGFE